MKILIKGAGDLATGIASRLYHAGHQIMMTEIDVPLTVRRTVAFSRAVYEQEVIVEDMKGILVSSMQEAQKVFQDGDIAVIVDPSAEIRKEYQPDVIVDAILAKKNLGTTITDAAFVIGVGPGFTAGEDCHCVVETKRGHTLGSVIWEGSAIPNTGVPGNVGGYTIERLIKASANGVIEPKVSIGEMVEQGQLVAMTGNQPVYAQMTGIVRGMLQDGVFVTEGLKIGDIDARCEVFHCHTISDKAKAIGGGVLEAVSNFERINGRYAIVVLAAGESSRFGGEKLLEEIEGKPMYQHMLEKASAFGGLCKVIVTGNPQIKNMAKLLGFDVIENKEPKKGISHSLKLALTFLLQKQAMVQGVLFAVCDQPWIRISTIQKIVNEGALHPNHIICAGHCGERGNPVFWGKKYFNELLKTEGDFGGKQIMKYHEEHIKMVECTLAELKDIDRRTDLANQKLQ